MLFRIANDNLVQVRVLREEEVAISKTRAPCRFGGEHVQSLAAAGEGEGAHAVLALALQMSILVHFRLAFGVRRQDDFIVRNLHCVAVLVERDALQVRCSACAAATATTTTSPSEPATVWPTAAPSTTGRT